MIAQARKLPFCSRSRRSKGIGASKSLAGFNRARIAHSLRLISGWPWLTSCKVLRIRSILTCPFPAFTHSSRVWGSTFSSTVMAASRLWDALSRDGLCVGLLCQQACITARIRTFSADFPEKYFDTMLDSFGTSDPSTRRAGSKCASMASRTKDGWCSVTVFAFDAMGRACSMSFSSVPLGSCWGSLAQAPDRRLCSLKRRSKDGSSAVSEATLRKKSVAQAGRGTLDGNLLESTCIDKFLYSSR